MGKIDIELKEFNHKYVCRDFIPRKYQDNMTRFMTQLSVEGKDYFRLLEEGKPTDARTLKEQDMIVIQKVRDEVIKGCVIDPKIDLDSDECNAMEIEILSARIQEEIGKRTKEFQIIKKKES